MTRPKMYDCPCGKKHKSRSTVWLHSMKMQPVEKQAQQAENEAVEHSEKSTTIEQKSLPSEQEKSNIDGRVKKISLLEEFENMVEEMKPKEQKTAESNEPNYQCGACKKQFYWPARPKACPECGQQF